MKAAFARALAFAVLVTSSVCYSQGQVQDVTVEKINDHLFMLVGMGGNIGLSIGNDATFIVDDQMAPIVPKLKSAIAELTDRPVDFVLNTHWHADHTGGNEIFAAGGGVIIAHDNVYRRMSTTQVNSFFGSTRPPSPEGALPVMTFDNTATLHLNGDTIRVLHMPDAHTDGDVVVFFEESNVYHLGDTYFSEIYPYFDVDSGGTLDGMIACADRVLAMADDEATIIPGHGAITGVGVLREYRDMMATVRQRVAKLIEEGASLEAVLAAKPTAEFDQRWAGGEFMPTDRWLGLVYRSLSNSP